MWFLAARTSWGQSLEQTLKLGLRNSQQGTGLPSRAPNGYLAPPAGTSPRPKEVCNGFLFQWMNHSLVCSQFCKPVWCCNLLCISNSRLGCLVLFLKWFPLEFRKHNGKTFLLAHSQMLCQGVKKLAFTVLQGMYAPKPAHLYC